LPQAPPRRNFRKPPRISTYSRIVRGHGQRSARRIDFAIAAPYPDDTSRFALLTPVRGTNRAPGRCT